MRFLSDAAGISLNWSGGMRIPNIADMSGILNAFRLIGIGSGKINPYSICSWGIVGDKKGYPPPRQN